MTTELPIAVIALKINAQTSISNFRRTPDFFASFSFFYNKLLTDLYKHPACIEIKQQGNTITILWNLDKANIESILAKHKTIHKILRETNKSFANCPIHYLVVLEAGICNMIQLQHNSKSPTFIMQSDMIERTQKVLSSIEGAKYPQIMFTNDFYKLLPEKVKAKIFCPYYFFHICCYSFKPHR
ncbi:hypothetical protein [Phascolarctobacterium succinatutens]|uniref:hypothetical protein n=1 Tax=Phascolarctobacterium succinatutens TaxID=626940 RepID=UPI003AB24059